MKKLTIWMNNVYSVLSDYDTELEWKLTVAHEGYWFSPQYKKGLWDGKTHFLKIPELKVSTGLVHIIEEYCKEKEIECIIIDKRKIPDIYNAYVATEGLLNGITLRDYQIDAINEAIKRGRGVLELPTGSGKTEIAAGIIKLFCLRTLFLVHTKTLLYQTVERFKNRLGQDIGLIGDGLFKDNADGIVVGMVQSLNSMLKTSLMQTKDYLMTFPILFMDECHHSSASTWAKIAMFMHNAYYRFGLSGTILRRDNLSNMKMLAVLGAPIYRLPTIELIEKGTLSHIKVHLIENDEEIKAEEWAEIYTKGVVKSERRNSLIINVIRKEFENNKRIMVLIRYLEQGRILKESLNNDFNIPVIFLRGADSSEYRENIKKRFNEGEKFVLIASTIFSEGVDIPNINVLVIASGGKSEVLTIQRVGRGLRKKEGENILTVYDIIDTKTKFLKKHSEKRIMVYKKEQFLKETNNE